LTTEKILLTRLVPVAEIPSLVASGKIQHSLVVVALYYFELWQRGSVRSAGLKLLESV